jgi:hypothetical protein
LAWTKVIELASTFDPRSETVEGGSVAGFEDVDAASTVSDMRRALYAEWRRWNHLGVDPEPAIVERVIQIVSWIRDQVPQS